MTSKHDDALTPDDPRWCATVMRKLAEPFTGDDTGQVKVGGGRTVPYIKGSAVTARLNAATGGRWSERIVEIERRPLHVNRWNDASRRSELVELPAIIVYLELTIPGVGQRVGMGTQMIEPGAGDAVSRGVITTARKNAAKAFDVGRGYELDDDDDELINASPPVRGAAAVDTGELANAQQRATVLELAAKVEMSGDDLRKLTGVQSSELMTDQQARWAIQELQRLLNAKRRGQRR